MRLLSVVEYNNTLADLLGDHSAPLAISPTATGDWFDNNASASSVSERLAEHYVEVAETVSAHLVDRLDQILPCVPAEVGEKACARAFVASFARRAFRRPASGSETEALFSVYEAGAGQGGFTAGIQWVVQATLQSPDFLYHVELGDPGEGDDGTVILTGDEIASRLSYFLWNTMPDEALFAAADRGDLDTPEGIAIEAARLLDDPRARASVRHFHRQWLELDRLDDVTKDPELFPGFSETRDDLQEQTLAFLEDAIWSGGNVAKILLADSSPEAQRPGLLTQPGLMAAHAKFQRTSPVQRGLFVRRRFLCQDLPPPPPDVPPLPAIDPDVNERERLAQHRADPVCAGCHRLMDPVGLAFEHYDAIGAWRDIDDDGTPIDATGELIATGSVDGLIDGAAELSARLAGSEQVSDCIATQWFRYAMGRAETEADACTLDDLQERFADGDHRIFDLLIAITQLDAFRSRTIADRSPGDC